ncbi:N-6 DNA methylase [Pseudomonas neustonica]|uniref:N-6 DNA methylase n=1 Tax=Pseudomonas neustonica TaxID=2487346 RepID=UPI003F47E393
MKAAIKKLPTGSPDTHRKNMIKLLEQNSRRHHMWEVFSDFVEMAALAMANSVDVMQYPPREARYMQIIERYEPDEQKRFPQILGELVCALEHGPDDLMGKLFGELEQGNSERGQFFTPYSVCQAMAQMNVGDGEDILRRIDERGFVTVSEPACGAGALVIAMASAMQAKRINYQQHLHVTAIDIDSRAVHMAYLQFSLLHIPAVIILGNALTMEERQHWYTPAHFMGLWQQKLKRGYAMGSALDKRLVDPASGRHLKPGQLIKAPTDIQLELFATA